MTAPANEARKRWLLIAVIVCATAAAASGGPLLLRGPTFVDKLSIVNPSEYDIHVEASGNERQGWTSVTTADRDSTTDALDVIDQGALWVFRFSAQGRQGGELRITRTDLDQAGWSIQIPGSVIERVRQLGASPSP